MQSPEHSPFEELSKAHSFLLNLPLETAVAVHNTCVLNDQSTHPGSGRFRLNYFLEGFEVTFAVSKSPDYSVEISFPAPAEAGLLCNKEGEKRSVTDDMMEEARQLELSHKREVPGVDCTNGQNFSLCFTLIRTL